MRCKAQSTQKDLDHTFPYFYVYRTGSNQKKQQTKQNKTGSKPGKRSLSYVKFTLTVVLAYIPDGVKQLEPRKGDLLQSSQIRAMQSSVNSALLTFIDCGPIKTSGVEAGCGRSGLGLVIFNLLCTESSPDLETGLTANQWIYHERRHFRWSYSARASWSRKRDSGLRSFKSYHNIIIGLKL